MRAVAERGVRTSLVRPSTAYGHGGYVPLLFAPQNGVVHYFGDGENRWSVVHVDELGELYRLAAARAPAGSVYNAASGTRVAPWPREETEQTLGLVGRGVSLDHVTSSERARHELGWAPSRLGLIDELRGEAGAAAA